MVDLLSHSYSNNEQRTVSLQRSILDLKIRDKPDAIRETL